MLANDVPFFLFSEIVSIQSVPPPTPPSLSSKRLISAKAFVLHEAHCRRHLRLCPECQEPVPVQDMEEHHRENHAPQSCDRCGATMPADRLEEHLVSITSSPSFSFSFLSPTPTQSLCLPLSLLSPLTLPPSSLSPSLY